MIKVLEERKKQIFQKGKDDFGLCGLKSKAESYMPFEEKR